MELTLHIRPSIYYYWASLSVYYKDKKDTRRVSVNLATSQYLCTLFAGDCIHEFVWAMHVCLQLHEHIGWTIVNVTVVASTSVW